MPKLGRVNATRTLVCPILVGRDDLLDLADRRIREVATGQGRLLLLAGEAGVGKTRLLGAIERRAAAAGFTTIRGGAYPSDLRVPAAILIDLARGMLRSTSTEGLGRALADRLEDDGRPTSDPHRRRRLLVLDVAEILAETARTGAGDDRPRRPPLVGRPDPRDPRGSRAAPGGVAAPRRRDVPERRAVSARADARLASAAARPAAGRGGPARAADARRHRRNDDAPDRDRPARCPRHGRRGPRPDGRHPAPHRGAARRAGRERPRRCRLGSARPTSRDRRGGDRRSDRAAVGGRARSLPVRAP